jgi:uncharacterized protein
MTVQDILEERLRIQSEQIASFCRKWRIVELSLFGSVLRDDFRPDSDVDILVSFDDAALWTLWDFVGMKEELERMLGRTVDLVSKRSLKNAGRRESILRTRQTLYAA